MPGIYIYSDQSDISAEIVALAKKAQKEAHIIVFSQQEAEASQCYGADRVCLLKGDSPLAENYGKALAEFLKSEGAELFAVGATARGRDLAARTAGYLGCGMVSDATAVGFADGKVICERLMYGGAVSQRETLSGLSVVSIPAGKFEATSGGASEIISVEVKADSRVRLVETAPIVKEGVDLSAADKVVCVGMGLEKEEDMKMVRDLAEALGAEIGCTRGIAEERRWLPVEQYVGISGAVIKPQLYLSMGVSGQVQHTVGVRDAKIIVAVDSNEKAPIFKAADYGIVGDMYEVIPLLTQALRNRL